MMMIEKHENKKVRMRTLDAALTRISSFKNKAITMNKPVIRMDACGVLNLALILSRNSGKRPSLLKAMGYLEAAMIPEFAVETNARIAAMLKAIFPKGPMKEAAPSEIGVRELSSCAAPSTPVVTKTTKM